MAMISKTRPSKKRNKLHFSVWDETQKNGHALFVGNLFDTIHYLSNSDSTSLKVSVFDLECMRSIVQVSATKWLHWYKHTAGELSDF